MAKNPTDENNQQLDHYFTSQQRQLLTVILDTVFQAHPTNSADEENNPSTKLFSYAFSSLPDYRLEDLIQALITNLPPSSLAQFRLGLNFLSSRPATYVLSGHFATFAEIPIDRRQQVLAQWAVSPLALKRSLFSAFVTVPLFQIYSNSLTIQNLLGFPASGDPRVNDPGRRKPSYGFKFIELPTHSLLDSEPIQVLETEVVIVGSGAGGSVVASLVAKAGYETLVIEKGRYVPTENISGSVSGFDDMLEGNGQLTTADKKLLILAGSTFGGGTTINWSASLATPFHVRRDWAEQHGLPYFTTTAYADDLKAVTDRLGISTKSIVHSKSNQMMLDAGRKIGVHVDVIPQNTAGNTHDCGLCVRGCPFGEKQGAPQTWLKDCAEAGGKFLQSTRVERILFSADPNPDQIDLHHSTPNAMRRFAVGVLACDSKTGKRFIVRARRAVVCSSGAISTPALLLRSGVSRNGAVGKGLHLHPVTTVTGWFEEPIRPWEGSIMTVISCEPENRKGTHYGSKIEVAASNPGLCAGFSIPWKSSHAHKEAMAGYAHSFSLVIIGRDRGSGRVTADKLTGEPIVDYVLDSFDGESITEGIIISCRLMAAAGAKKILTTQPAVNPFHVNTEGDEAQEKFESWLKKVKQAGIKSGWGSLASAHQMSSCRMGGKPSNSSVVSEKGKVWGFEKLWIADGSTLPSATGVNPFLSIMGVSHSIGKKLVAELNKEDEASLRKPSKL